MRDLGGRQPTEEPQRQRDLRFTSERWMATGEDQPQPLVRHARGDRFLHGRLVLGRRRELRELRCARTQGAFASQPVDRAVTRDGEDPRRGVARHAVARPAFGCRRERVLDALLGEVPVADGADERRDRPPEVLSEQTVDGAGCDPLAQDAVCSAPAASASQAA